MNKVVYLVKFDRGYYAAKQPGYQQAYTDDVFLAQTYNTLKKAEERGEWGINLITDAPKVYVIEKYEVKTTMELMQ